MALVVAVLLVSTRRHDRLRAPAPRAHASPSTQPAPPSVPPDPIQLVADDPAAEAANPPAPGAAAPAAGGKPNILFIMGDDIGYMQPGIYHRGLMVGETPNIDRIGREGAMFTDYYAMQSCTSGRNAFFTGMYPLRTRTSSPARPRSPR
jgi:arylsulfatase